MVGGFGFLISSVLTHGIHQVPCECGSEGGYLFLNVSEKCICIRMEWPCPGIIQECE